MTPERLRALLEGGETLAVEFKSEATVPLPDRELVENVVCLANRSDEGPGWLLIGVEDDGRVSGARPRHEATKQAALILYAYRPLLPTVRFRLCPRGRKWFRATSRMSSLWRCCPRANP